MTLDAFVVHLPSHDLEIARLREYFVPPRSTLYTPGGTRHSVENHAWFIGMLIYWLIKQ